MAALPDADRQKITRGIMRWWSNQFEPVAGVTKADLRAAIDATDDWINANAGAYNSALPVAARTNLTAAQKTIIFCAVAAFRVSQAFAIRLFGEVD